MMTGKKKKTSKTDKVAATAQSALAALSDALLESFHEEGESEMDVFELYVHALRTKLQFQKNDLSARLYRGYQVLVNPSSANRGAG